MDLLQFLMALPGRLMSAALRLAAQIKVWLKPILGTVSWSRPPWVGEASAHLRSHSRQYAGGATAAVLALLVGFIGYQLYIHRPHPPEPEKLTFSVSDPEVTTYETASGAPTIVVHPAQIVFSGSAAPIELVGKEASRGITMSPAIDGVWRWVDDRTLTFTPKRDWPVGAHIDVTFDPALAFAHHVLVAEDHLSLTVAPFHVETGSGEFYQDPENPAAKKTITQVAFNYPVDPAEFEKRIALVLKGKEGLGDTPLKFTVTYDAAKIKAWIHSQPLALPRDEDVVTLDLDAGVRSSRGGDPTGNHLQMAVRVPGLYSLTVGDLNPQIANNDKYEPEQVVILTTSDAVKGSDLAQGTRAWILPKRRPGVKQPKNAPPYDWSTDEVSDSIVKQSRPLKLELVPTEQEFSDSQSFKYRAEPGDRIYVKFAPGIRSFGGYILGKGDVRVFAAPDYPKLLHFMADGSLLSLSGDRSVSIVSRNVSGMKVEVGRVLPDQLQHLVSFNEGSYAKPSLSYSFAEDHIVERFTQTRAFPQGDPADAHYEGVDLGQYLKPGMRGIFLLHLSEFDPNAAPDTQASNDDSDDSADDSGDESSSEDSTTADTRLVVITDLGLLAKKNLDGSRDVFVQSISSGSPVGGAVVSVLALNGSTLFSQTTGADGAVHFPSLKGLTREKKPVMYVVTRGDDLSFLPISSSDRRLDYSRFDIGGIANAANDGQLSAYLFSDRGIYRPGDKFHIGIILRAANWAQSVAGVPLRAEIVDPRGQTVRRQPVSTDASGFTELDYTPSETAPTGTWGVNLYIVGKDNDDQAIGSTTVSVKEFLPDSMKVQASLSNTVADGWVKPAGLKGIVDVSNLFGTPASGRRVQASITLSPTFPAFRGWPDYQFYDLRHAKDGYTTDLQDGRTDDKGHVEFDLDLKKYADATYRLDFLSKAYEPVGGRNVAATVETLVSNNPWLVGYKAADDLSYVKRGSQRSVKLVAIDSNTKAIALNGLVAQLVERRYVSILTKQDSGVYKYESRQKEIPIWSKPLAIRENGLDYALPTDKPGDYALLIRFGNASVNRIEYSVTGDANLTRSLERNAELQVKLDKDDYAPGETIDVSLRAPYAGSGLITIERDKVYAHAWFRATTTNSVQHIAVPAGFEGNGYINVQYIRDPGSDEIFMSPLSYGVAPFSVNIDARRDPLTIDAPALVKPGQVATFRLHTGRAAKVVVFAVDEGILQVAHYKLGDPLKFFFQKRMLEVQTSQILDLILPEFKHLMALAAPGGDGGDAISRQLNPFKRKRDKPVAYWSGIVDANGDKTFSYAVPDYFHGKMRVMAVAVSPGLIGTAENSVTVRGDFVLSPDAPTTLAPGDEAEVGVGVANSIAGGGSQAVPVAVALKTGPQLQVIGPAVQKLSLAAMHEGTASFRVRATGVLGSGNLAFTASYGAKSARQSVDISVRPAAAFRSQIDIARIGAGTTVVKDHLRPMYDAYARRDVSISTTPMVMTVGLSSWLVNYDNYCSEQIISASMPRLLAAKWSAVPVFARALTPVKNSQTGDAITGQINALRSRQNDAGGFGVWAATPQSEPFVSAYAVHFLLEARDRGIAIPKDMLDSGDGFLRQLAADEGLTTLGQQRQRAYAIYLLTRQGVVTTNYIATLQKRLDSAYPKSWKNDLTAAWLAASYRMLKQDKQANALIQPLQDKLYQPSSSEPYFYDYYDDPLTRDATVLYLLAKHFPERARNLSPAIFDRIAGPLQRNEFNTTSAAMTMLALDTYARNNAMFIDKLKIEQLDAKGVKSIASVQNGLLQAGSWSSNANVRVTNAGPIPAWYVVDQEGYDRGIPKVAIGNGIEIVREYTDAHGKAIDHATLGQEIDVHVKIRSTGNKGIGDIAIVDLLPGGFEPVLNVPATADDETPSAPTLRLSSSTWSPDYTDMREDRVVIYGTATPDVRQFVYRIRATAAGHFVEPPAYGESMYDRRVQARAAGGSYLTVVKP